MSPEEIKYCEYMKDCCGTFYGYLIKAIEYSDDVNKKLISKAYPGLVKVVHNVKYQEGYIFDLKDRWNKIYKGNKFDFL